MSESEAKVSMATTNDKKLISPPSLYVLDGKRLFSGFLSQNKDLIPWRKIQKRVQHRKVEVTIIKGFTVTL